MGERITAVGSRRQLPEKPVVFPCSVLASAGPSLTVIGGELTYLKLKGRRVC